VQQMPALPEAEYLVKIGQIAYTVGSIEWLILGELSALNSEIPSHLSVSQLAGRSTGQIAGQLTDALAKINQADVRAFIAEGAAALAAMSERRNALLHSRPATIDGKQRLHRWLPGVAFSITDDWLAQVITEGNSWYRRVDSLRSAARSACQTPPGA